MKFNFEHPAVLMFGAGATRGAFENSLPPPPMDRDFFDIAIQIKGHGTQRIAKKVLKSVWELYSQTSGISLERYYRDIETRAKVGDFAKSANQPKDWEKRQSELEELVRRVLIHTTCEEQENHLKPKKPETHKKILGLLKEGDIVLTFNYDLVIEESLPNKLWSPSDGYGNWAGGKTSDWSRKWMKNHDVGKNFKSKIKLLKLHGSFNWTLYNNSNVRLKPRPYVVRTKSGNPATEKISILPPGWDKRIDLNPYKNFWREARLKLERCKSLVILGYSLPDTDLLAQALFAEVVRLRSARKNYLKELHIVDPSDAVKDKLMKLFFPALGPYGVVYKYDKIQDILN